MARKCLWLLWMASLRARSWKKKLKDIYTKYMTATPRLVMLQGTVNGDWCTFYHDGLCELHDKGLKPTEGRLSHHSMRLDNWTPKKSISWNVAKEWEDEDNAPVLEEILDELKKHKGL